MAVLLLIDDFWFPVIQIYNTISDKCVGNLLSARKHGFVAFEGEMLYQVFYYSIWIELKWIPLIEILTPYCVFLFNDDRIGSLPCRGCWFGSSRWTMDVLQRRDEDTEITLAKPIEEIVKLLPIVYDPTLPDNLQEWIRQIK